MRVQSIQISIRFARPLTGGLLCQGWGYNIGITALHCRSPGPLELELSLNHLARHCESEPCPMRLFAFFCLAACAAVPAESSGECTICTYVMDKLVDKIAEHG